MATIKIEIELKDLMELISERDELRQEVIRLTATPLEFSLEWLAKRVDVNYMEKRSYTPDQRETVRKAILNCGI